MPTPDAAALLKKLQSSNKGDRINAVQAIGKLRDTGILTPLVGALHDESWEVRYHAAEALGTLGDPKSIAPLSRMLTDTHYKVKDAAKTAIIRITPLDDLQRAEKAVACEQWELAVKLGRNSVNPLLERLQRDAPPVGVAKALGQLKDERAIEPLIGAMKISSSADFVLAVGNALVEMGTENVIVLLHNALSDKNMSSKAKEVVPYIVEKIGSPAAVVPLVTLILNEIDSITVRNAARSLYSVLSTKADSVPEQQIAYIATLPDKVVVEIASPEKVRETGSIAQVRLDFGPLRKLAQEALDRRHSKV